MATPAPAIARAASPATANQILAALDGFVRISPKAAALGDGRADVFERPDVSTLGGANSMFVPRERWLTVPPPDPDATYGSISGGRGACSKSKSRGRAPRIGCSSRA